MNGHRRKKFSFPGAAPRRLALAAALAVLAGCASVEAGPPSGVVTPLERTLDRYFAPYLQARLAMASGDNDRAAKILKKSMRNKDCPAPYYASLAELYIEDRQWDNADKTLKRAMERHPGNVNLLVMRARIEGLRGQFSEAAADLEHALKATPHRQDLLEELSDIQLKQLKQAKSEKDAEAIIDSLIATYERMLETREGIDRLPPLLVTSSLYVHNDRLVEARERAEEAIRLYPNEVRPYLALASACEAGKDFEGALAAYARAMKADADAPDLLGSLNALLEIMEPGRARSFYCELAEQYPGDRDIRERVFQELTVRQQWDAAQLELTALYEQWPDRRASQLGLTLASLLIDAGRTEEGLEALKAHREAFPGDYVGVALLASLYVREDRREDALALLEGLSPELKRAGDNELTLLQAQLLYNMERDEEALAIFRQLIAEHGEVADYHRRAAFAYQDLGRMKEAETAYLKAIELAPADAEMYNSLGFFYAETEQKLDKAEQLINKALELSPGAAHILDSLGWVYYKQGKYKQAVEQIEQAVHLMSPEGSAEVYDHLGDAYRGLGNNAAAAEAWRKALDQPDAGDDDAKNIEGKLETVQ